MSNFKFPDENEEVESPEVEVEIVSDDLDEEKGRLPPEKEGIDPTDEELSSYSKNVQGRIQKLTRARHDERIAKEAVSREKQELERIAQQLFDENNELKKFVNTGSQQFMNQSKTLAQKELDTARSQYKVAQEAFDADAILAAQESLLEAKMKINAINNFKQTPLQTSENRVQPRSYEQPEPQLDEKTLRWQAKNQWFSADGFEDVSSYALGLHKKLMNSGYDPQSDEYFEQIDARVKEKFPEVFGNERQRSNETSKRPTSVVAPAARSSGSKKIQMTPRAMALAKKFGITPQQYAAQVAKLEKSND